MILPTGKWRIDVIMMGLYQLALFFSAQLVFTIFLDYMPKTYCNDRNYCYKLKNKCLTNYDGRDPNLCDYNSTNFEDCVTEKKYLYFKSAQFEYQQDCTNLTYYNSTTNMYIGSLLANLILGYLADRFGRRPIYLLSIGVGVISLILSAAIPYLGAFYLFRFLTGFGVSGVQIVGWSYGSEIISAHRRVQLRTFSNWANARILLVFVAFITRHWAFGSYLCAMISALIVPLLIWLPESPVFLAQKEKYDEAKAAKKKIDKICGMPFNEDEIVVKKSVKHITFFGMFKIHRLKVNFFVLCFMWFYIGMTTYIVDLNGADMSSNFYVGQFLSGLLLTISKIVLGLVEPHCKWLGRRMIFLFSQGIALAAYVLILVGLYSGSKGSTWYLISYLCAYTFQALSTETCYLSAAELMPTDIRVTATAFFNISLRLGTILASTTKELKYTYEPALFFINLIVGSIGITVVYLKLEESRNCDLSKVGKEDGDEEASLISTVEHGDRSAVETKTEKSTKEASEKEDVSTKKTTTSEKETTEKEASKDESKSPSKESTTKETGSKEKSEKDK